jgi:glutathione S-transferase
MSDFTVWTIPGSPFARAVIAVLIEKAADFRIARLTPGTLKSEEHRSRHPFGKMPVLDHGDFRLYETQAILGYLDRILPEPRLTPSNPRTVARMDQLMNINDHYLFNGVANVIGFQRVVGPLLLGLTPDEEAIAAAMPAAQTVFCELSRLLAGQAYFTGNQPSLADFMLFGQIDFFDGTPEWAPLTGGRRNLVNWHQRMSKRPSIQGSTMQTVGKAAMAVA